MRAVEKFVVIERQQQFHRGVSEHDTEQEARAEMERRSRVAREGVSFGLEKRTAYLPDEETADESGNAEGSHQDSVS